MELVLDPIHVNGVAGVRPTSDAGHHVVLLREDVDCRREGTGREGGRAGV